MYEVQENYRLGNKGEITKKKTRSVMGPKKRLPKNITYTVAKCAEYTVPLARFEATPPTHPSKHENMTASKPQHMKTVAAS